MIKFFRLNRKEDLHGNSGEGAVAVGVILPNGKVVLSWRTEITSTTIFDSISNVEELHSHNGRTEIEFFTPSKPMQKALQAFLDGEDIKKRGKDE